MQTATEHISATSQSRLPKNSQQFPPLELETRSHVETNCAAFYLNRSAKTLRCWACYESGPVRPQRINGRLAWPVAEIKRLLNGGADV